MIIYYNIEFEKSRSWIRSTFHHFNLIYKIYINTSTETEAKAVLLPVKEVLEVPPGSHAAVPLAHLLCVGLAEQLHPHHGEDEDDDAEHEDQVGDGGHSGLHDAQDVIE